MKINEIIRIKRKEKGYTQEQMAALLGVSAPAVNKWEKAASYPDITLLPALARVLGTDLNTLLSFQEELTKEEIGTFLNELVSVADTKGVDAAFHMALDKLHEYPSCELLLLNTALTLEGLFILDKDNTSENTVYAKRDDYMDNIHKMYERASHSCDPQISEHAKAMLISKYIAGKDFDSAEKLLTELPDRTPLNKTQLQSTLYREQGKWDQAAQLIERKILTEISNIHSFLLALTEIAVKENHLSDARQLTDIAKETADLFGLWKYSVYLADFQLAVIQKDNQKCLQALSQLLPALEQGWTLNQSPIYRHISSEQGNKGNNIGQRFLPGILGDLENPENHMYDFLREDPEIQHLLQKYSSKIL